MVILGLGLMILGGIAVLSALFVSEPGSGGELLGFDVTTLESFFVGVAAVAMAVRAPLPTWLRVVTAVAGVCGILAPLFFTYFLFALWTVGFGAWVLRQRRPVASDSPVQASLV